VDESLAELAYSEDTLGLDGVVLLSNYGGTYLGDPAFEPLFEELDRRAVFVHAHPSSPPHPPILPQFPQGTYEPAFETTRAIMNLVYSGTLERYQSVKLQFCHLGGSLPHLAYRAAAHMTAVPELEANAPAGLFGYLDHIWYDTAQSNFLEMLTVTLGVASLDRIVFGTDWPFHDLALIEERSDDPAPRFAGLDPAERAQIEGLNARALVPRLVGALAPA
jgi:predicted TIM-barrel fold metal-dependent hydrolase